MEQIDLSSPISTSVSAASGLCAAFAADSALTTTPPAIASPITSTVTLASPIDLEDLP